MTDKIQSKSKIELTVTLTLSEVEARALNAMTVYGSASFLKGYYAQLGRHYIEPYAEGVKSLFKAINNQLPEHLERADKARKVFNERQNP